MTPGHNDREDPHISAFVALVALYIAWLLALWFFAREINIFTGSMAWVITKPFALLAGTLDALTTAGSGAGDMLRRTLPGRWFLTEPEVVVRFLESADYAGMDPEQKHLVSAVAGRCLALVSVPCLLAMAVAGRSLRPDEAYRTRHDLDSIIRHHAGHWTAARYASVVNPMDRPETEGAAIAAETRKRRETALAANDNGDKDRNGEEAGTASGLLAMTVVPQALPAWGRALRPEEWLDAQGIEWDDENCDLDEVEAALAGQLRRPWTGWASLAIHERALAAIFVLFNAYRRDEAEALLDDLAVLDSARGVHIGMKQAIKEEKGLPARIDAVLGSPDAAAAPEGGKSMMDVADAHAWVETAMVAMYVEARRGKGILASARFIWLKRCDRTLWYALNNTGGNACMAECAGIMAHYKAETQFGMPVARPYVGQAAKALVIDYLDLDEERVAKRREKKQRARSVADEVRQEADLARRLREHASRNGG